MSKVNASLIHAAVALTAASIDWSSFTDDDAAKKAVLDLIGADNAGKSVAATGADVQALLKKEGFAIKKKPSNAWFEFTCTRSVDGGSKTLRVDIAFAKADDKKTNITKVMVS